MLTKNDRFTCDECGKFIPTDDLVSGSAIHKLLEPDSDLGAEKWMTVCKRCRDQPQPEGEK